MKAAYSFLLSVIILRVFFAPWATAQDKTLTNETTVQLTRVRGFLTTCVQLPSLVLIHMNADYLKS